MDIVYESFMAGLNPDRDYALKVASDTIRNYKQSENKNDVLSEEK